MALEYVQRYLMEVEGVYTEDARGSVATGDVTGWRGWSVASSECFPPVE